ncbi:hypothetical protein RZS08_49180, partial [Arthrospira platensis SPKY1]|nr:hypothetical protein [Arthrospira platensis SPKY1]
QLGDEVYQSPMQADAGALATAPPARARIGQSHRGHGAAEPQAVLLDTGTIPAQRPCLKGAQKCLLGTAAGGRQQKLLATVLAHTPAHAPPRHEPQGQRLAEDGKLHPVCDLDAHLGWCTGMRPQP